MYIVKAILLALLVSLPLHAQGVGEVKNNAGNKVLNFGWSPPKTKPKLNKVWQGQLSDLVKYNDESDALLYRFLYQALKDSNLLSDWEKETGRLASLNQGNVGGCVGWSTCLVLEVTAAADIYHRNENEVWKARGNPAAIYALGRLEHLGGWDGSTAGWNVDALKKYGSLHRLMYGEYDIIRSRPEDGRKWSRDGLPAGLLKHATEHKALNYVQVTSIEQAKALMQNGYAIVSGAQASYGSTRDSQGFTRRSGTVWSHSLCFDAYRGKGSGKEGFLCSNSWGGGELHPDAGVSRTSWNNGPIWPPDQPAGSFWVTPEDFMFHIKQGDTYSISNYEGFKRRKLKWDEVFKIGEEIKDE